MKYADDLTKQANVVKHFIRIAQACHHLSYPTSLSLTSDRIVTHSHVHMCIYGGSTELSNV
jgi:hypothetical protein